MSNMETLSPKTSEKRWIIRKAFTLALCGALALGNASCGHKTEKDVMEQQMKVEALSFQISHYISARKWFVEKYNTLLKYPKTEDKLDAEVDLNDYIAEAWSGILPNNPIDPNKWDFLLAIQ